MIMLLSRLMHVLRLLFLLVCSHHATSNPSSNPYIPFRSSPYDQQSTIHHEIDWQPETIHYHPHGTSSPHEHDDHDRKDHHAHTTPIIRSYDEINYQTHCPLQFSLGISKRMQSSLGGSTAARAIYSPPVIHPIYPARTIRSGGGKQIIYTTQYEHLDVLTPSALLTPGHTIKEVLIQANNFPLLLESSSFHSSPIVHDVNGDGIADVIVSDYDGGIYVIGLSGNPRFYHHVQVPRLYLRREWLHHRVQEELNNTYPNRTKTSSSSLTEESSHTNMTTDQTTTEESNTTKAIDEILSLQPNEPYHSYFELYYAGMKTDSNVLRGVTANLLDQDHKDVTALKERRKRRIQYHTKNESNNIPLTKGDDDSNMAESQQEQQQDLQSPVHGNNNDNNVHKNTGEQEVHIHRRLQERIESHEENQHVNNPTIHQGENGKGTEDHSHNHQQEANHQEHNQQQDANHHEQHQEIIHQEQHHEQQQGNPHDRQQGAIPTEQQHEQQQAIKHEQQHEQRQAEPHKEVNLHEQQHEQRQANVHEQQNEQGHANQHEQQQEVIHHEQQHGQQQANPHEHQHEQRQANIREEQQEAIHHEQQHNQQQKVDSYPQQEANHREKQQAIHTEQKEGSLHGQLEANHHQQQEGSYIASPGNQGEQVGGHVEKIQTDHGKSVEEIERKEAEVRKEDETAERFDTDNQDVAADGPESILDNIDYSGEGHRRGLPMDDIAADMGVDDPGMVQQQRMDKRNQMMGGDDYIGSMDDPDYARDRETEDDYFYAKRESVRSDFYDTKHYIRVPPHILCDPVLAELPKLYGNTNEMDIILFVAVSYYLDEDEYQGFFSYKRFTETDHGDETEVKRGSYVASAILSYIVGGPSPRWNGQSHLDLSTDFTAPENVTLVGEIPVQLDKSKMGAFALASPTVADLDGDGSPEVLIGTSMGLVYAFDARQLFKRERWPIQMKYPVESRILVEDVVGDTNLEIFVADIGGNIICLNHEANRIWNRNLVLSLGLAPEHVEGMSPMALGDINGDGILDLVTTIQVGKQVFLFALNAATGVDIDQFPIQLSESMTTATATSHQMVKKIPQPLLIDLHGDQSHLKDYLARNGTKWTPTRLPSKKKSVLPQHGGSAPGLHIVQPVDDKLYIVEGGSTCTQVVSVGEGVKAMVQADDVHGTNRLDLVIATEAGNIITLESSAPYHPLNTHNHGELRGRTNANSHGYSASQGIFVHDASRHFVNVFGVYVPITMQIFDNRPGAYLLKPDQRKYLVEIRDGTHWDRVLWRKEYFEPGVYTERVYIRFGPGYYSLSVILLTSHGIVYEDIIQVGYNIHFLDGFGTMLWLPLVLSTMALFLCGSKRINWDEEDHDDMDRDNPSLGILGRTLPS